MMTPKMKEDLCTQILNASRQLFLSSKISEVCQEKGTQKQLEFVLELMNKELTLRDETGVCARTEEPCTVWSCWSRENTYGNRSWCESLQSWV